MTQLRSERPLVIYDGACPLCRKWMARWRRVTGECISYAAAQDMAGECPVSPDELAQAVHLVEPGGRISKGAEAVVRLLALSGRGRFPLRLYRKVPGMAGVMEFFYRFAARHRRRDVVS